MIADPVEMFARHLLAGEPERYNKGHDVSGELRDESGKWTTGGARNIASKPTDSKQFKAWFGKSKLMNEDGSPMRLYHGTTKDFNAFDPDKGLSIIDRLGSWLAVTPELAESRLKSWEKSGISGGSTGRIPEKSRTLAVYAAMDNPKVFKTRRDLDTYIEENLVLPKPLLDETIRIFGKHYRNNRSEAVSGSLMDVRNYYANADSRKRVNQDILSAEEWGMGDEEMNRIRDHARQSIVQHTFMGHDGIKIENDQGHGTAYVVFSPNKIKSATGNRGTFDPSQSRIDFASQDMPTRYAADPVEAFARHILGADGPEDDTDEWEDEDDEDADESASHKFSSTQVQLPDEIADAVRSVASFIPDEELAEDGREEDIHITVKYGLHTNEVHDVQEVAQLWGPVEIEIGKTSLFPAKETDSQRGGEQFDVLKLDVKGDSIHRLNKAISDQLECTDTHPKYVPHITIAYLKPGEGKKYEGLALRGITGEAITFESLMFSDKSHEKTAIPLVRDDDADDVPDQKALAEYYADAFNGYLDAGLGITLDEMVTVSEELEGGDWVLAFEDHAWTVKPADEMDGDGPIQFEQARSPKGGVTINGTFYRGGRWVPSGELSHASPEDKERIDKAKTDREGKRRGRGSVDTAKVRERLQPHGHHELSKAEMASARKAYATLKRHHGDLTVHRLEELADDLHAAIDATEDEGAREHFSRRLKGVEHMLEMAERQGVSGKVEEAKAEAEGEDEPKRTKKVFKDRAKSHNESLYSIVQERGGISISSLEGHGFDTTRLRESGLGGLFRRKGGLDATEMAVELHQNGDINIPGVERGEGHESSKYPQEAAQYLLDQLESKVKSLHADATKEYDAAYESYLKEQHDAEQYASESEVAETARRGKEAGASEAEKGDAWEDVGGLAAEESGGVDPWDEPGEVAPSEVSIEDARTEAKFKDQPKVELLRAPAGGATSEVDGIFYKGGRLMPVHGLSPKKDKSRADSGGPSTPSKANEDAEKRGERFARGPMSPEDIEAEKERRSNQSKWDDVRSGPLGSKLLHLGDKVHHIKRTSPGLRHWQEWADTVSDAKLAEVRDLARSLATDAVAAKDGDDKAKDYREYQDEFFANPGNGNEKYMHKKHVKEKPTSSSAHHWIGEAIENGGIDAMHKLHHAMK